MAKEPLVDAAEFTSEHLGRFRASLHELSDARDVDSALQLSVDLAAELIPGVAYSDIMFVRGGEISVPVSTNEITIAADKAQQETGEGPCLNVLRDHEDGVVVVEDFEQDDRWPAYGPRALELGIRATVAHRLFRSTEEGDTLGALNLFGTEPGVDDLAVELGGLFAAHCSTVLAAAMREEGAQAALRSRDVIGQAKGILMERHRLTADQAYAMLRTFSNDHNIKVRELAERVAQTGALPT